MERSTFFDEIKYDPFEYYGLPGKIPDYVTTALKRIGGSDGTGRPLLRIKWGPEIFWVRGDKRVPRYIVARDVVRRQKRTPGGIFIAADEPRYFSYPHFFVEEWRTVDKFVQSGDAKAAEADWKDHRIQTDLPITPINTDRSRKDLTIFTMPDGTQLTGPPDCSYWDLVAGGDPHKREDVLGQFPEGGRYDFFMRINPAFHVPDQHCVDLIEAAWKERLNSKYNTPEGEVIALVSQIEEQRAKAHEKLNRELAEDEMLAYDRLTSLTPRKGGTGPSTVILPGKEIGK